MRVMSDVGVVTAVGSDLSALILIAVMYGFWLLILGTQKPPRGPTRLRWRENPLYIPYEERGKEGPIKKRERSASSELPSARLPPVYRGRARWVWRALLLAGLAWILAAAHYAAAAAYVVFWISVEVVDARRSRA